jgi:TolB-like protein
MNNLFSELKRRNVFRVAGVYAVVGWLLMQAAALFEDSMHLPTWFDSVVTAALLLGFPIAVLLAWAFETTPEGVKRTEIVDGETASTSRKMDGLIIAALLGVLALGAYQQMTKPDIVYRDAAGNIETSSVMPKPQAALTPEPKQEIDDASIAVLPFADLSPDGDQEYFSDGVSEEILNVLAKLNALRVASRTSAFAYKSTVLRIPAIAQELGVRYVLEGSVRRSGESIRVTAQLIDSQTDEHLWSETYDRKLSAENVFSIQDEIAKSIVAELSTRLNLAKVEVPISTPADTSDIATLDLYYEANALFLLRGRENLTCAMTLFERLTKQEPEFARGWAGLSAVYTVAESWGLAPRDYGQLTLNAARRAIELNPKLSTPYAVLANLETGKAQPEWFSALKNFETAVQLNPNDPNLYNWRALFWESAGFPARASADIETCLRLDPSYINCAFNKLPLLLVMGEEQQAHALQRSLLMRGAQYYYSNVWFRHMVNERDDMGLLNGLNAMVAESYPGQRWIVKELYEAYTDPDFDYVTRKKLFNQRLEAAGFEINSNAQELGIIGAAFRDIESFRDNVETVVIFYSYFGFIPKEQIRDVTIAQGLPAFWREIGFPPNCRPLTSKDGGDDDFKCDW